jgi:hypothetical protein
MLRALVLAKRVTNRNIRDPGTFAKMGNNRGGTMKKIVSALLCFMASAAMPALAQTGNPGVSTPSAQNSGAGIPGQAGNKNGPAVKGTVGSSATDQNQTVRQQDAAKIKGLPGNKSGPAAKSPSR